jgi:hypothetical protein
MAFEITSDTVVKILVRRGLEIERVETLLSEGELGLSVDSRRLFIGDGYTLGGTPVGSINFGVINNLTDVTPYAQFGDMAVCNNLSYVFNYNGWILVSPRPYGEYNSNTGLELFPTTLEYSPSPRNEIRISQSGLGDGFLVDYSLGSSGNIGFTIQNVYGMVNFDARFLSLCAYRSNYDLNDGPLVGSLYFGNVFTKTVRDNLSATVNVERNIFINDHSASAFQLKATARDLTYNSSLIEATSGNLYVTSKNAIYLGTNTNGGSALIVSGAMVTSRNFDIVHSPANDGVNPVVRIGEFTRGSTTLSGFSGAFMSYDETTNTFGISSVFAPAMGTIAMSINRNGLGFYNATPIAQPTSPGLTTIDTPGAGTAVNSQSKFLGGVGSTQYSISDIVRVLKNLGLIAQ